MLIGFSVVLFLEDKDEEEDVLQVCGLGDFEFSFGLVGCLVFEIVIWRCLGSSWIDEFGV